MPSLHTRRQGARLWVELDSPASAVNVFGHVPAGELRALLHSLPDDVEQLVLCSTKPGSFINGAGLLYANSMKSPATAVETSADVRATYQLLAACPAQTIAVIEGNCYGCGLELALCCDARIARDCGEAHFKMTELVDYRFVPLFGGTWRLSRRVGAEAAKRLLLDGESWSATRAKRHGLVDATLSSDGFERQLPKVLDTWLEKGVPRQRRSRLRSRPREVPPGRVALWRRAEQLLDAASTSPDEVAIARELDAFADTVTSAGAKAAMRFFFVRHMARAASWSKTARTPPPVRLVPRRGDRSALARVLRDRRPLHGGRTSWTVEVGSRSRARVEGVALAFPLGPTRRLCELRPASASRADAISVARALDWLGFEPLLTTGDAFVSDRLLRRTREVVAASGLGRPALAAALWRYGFARPVPGVGQARSKHSSPRGVDLLLEAWRGEVQRAVEEGSLLHPSQGDVLIHELFDFPLERGSLSRVVAPVAAEVRR